MKFYQLINNLDETNIIENFANLDDLYSYLVEYRTEVFTEYSYRTEEVELFFEYILKNYSKEVFLRFLFYKKFQPLEVHIIDCWSANNKKDSL